MFLSRLTLSRSPDVSALGALLNPEHDGHRADAHHRLIWSAFSGDPDADRDFLWREMGQGQFLVLSRRAPRQGPLFEPPEVQDFVPELRAGDRLKVLLRANATRSVKAPDGRRKHHDVVMEALHPVPRDGRAETRMDIAQVAGRAWLTGQGTRAGFAVQDVVVQGYRVADLPGQGARKPRFGILDLSAGIEVTDPAALLDRIGQGFGRAKSFGCGLMLIRRA